MKILFEGLGLGQSVRTFVVPDARNTELLPKNPNPIPSDHRISVSISLSLLFPFLKVFILFFMNLSFGGKIGVNEKRRS